MEINPLNADLNPICPLLALFLAHHILNVSRQRVNMRMWDDNNTKIYVKESSFFRLHSSLHRVKAGFLDKSIKLFCTKTKNIFIGFSIEAF